MIEVCPFKKVIQTKELKDEVREVSTDFGKCNGRACPYFYVDSIWNQHCMKVEEHQK